MEEIKTLYSLDEVVLIPASVSTVESRSQCNPFRGKKLPLFIAPMSCVVDENNFEKFDQLGFHTIVPRTVSWEIRKRLAKKGVRIAVGLSEGLELVESREIPVGRLCIDIANGHQERAVDLCEALKFVHPQWNIMVGNIANPATYIQYAKAGADYVRVGIGSGQVCTTSVQTGIHYPMASLIRGCLEAQAHSVLAGYNLPKIVADGGFNYIDQIVKALALGADYVMIGKIAATFPEACGEINEETGLREYYGMSTEKAQKLMHPEPGYKPKHTEGTVRWVQVRENTQDWIDDFTHALKSSMSYCNAFTLDEFKGHVRFGIQNPTTFNAYIKS